MSRGPLSLPILAICTILGASFLLTISASRIAYANGYQSISHTAQYAQTLNQYRLTNSEFTEKRSEFGPLTVSVKYDGKEETRLTHASKVEEVLEELEVPYAEHDIIVPAPQEYVAENVSITIIKVDHGSEIIEEEILFETVYVEEPTLDTGKTKITQEGRNGLLTITYSLRYEDGVLIEKVESGREITLQPVNKVIAKGTKLAFPPEVTDGRCTEWKTRVDSITTDEYERAWLKYVMWKESRCNESNNYNPTYKGLFQYHPNTYANAGGTDIFNGMEQLTITLNTIRHPYKCKAWNYCPQGYR